MLRWSLGIPPQAPDVFTLYCPICPGFIPPCLHTLSRPNPSFIVFSALAVSKKKSQNALSLTPLVTSCLISSSAEAYRASSLLILPSKICVFFRSGPGKPNQRMVGSWTFRRGIPEQKFNVNRACFPKEKHQNSQKWTKFMNFLFWPFLWFGLPGLFHNFLRNKAPLSTHQHECGPRTKNISVAQMQSTGRLDGIFTYVWCTYIYIYIYGHTCRRHLIWGKDWYFRPFCYPNVLKLWLDC